MWRPGDYPPLQAVRKTSNSLNTDSKRVVTAMSTTRSNLTPQKASPALAENRESYTVTYTVSHIKHNKMLIYNSL